MTAKKGIAWALYIAMGIGVLLAYLFWVRPGSLSTPLYGHDQNKILEANAALLVAAFVLVVTVALVIAQLAAALGHSYGLRPKWRVTAGELFFITLAIGITLLGRWAGDGNPKDDLTVWSCILTAACYLVLAPYFWHQRQYISTDGVLRDAFSELTKGDLEENIVDVLLGAARRGDYLLFRDGVNRLRDNDAKDTRYRECLKYIEKALTKTEESLNGDSDRHATKIVRDALAQLRRTDGGTANATQSSRSI
jgi:hypothetical protein